LPSEPAPTAEFESGAYLGVHLGQDAVGGDIVVYLSTWPHALVGGTTGSGKTTLLRSIVTQIGGQEHVRLVVVDGKGEGDYIGLASDGAYATKFVGPQEEKDSAVDVVRWVLNEEIPSRRAIIRAEARRQGNRFDARSEYVAAIRERRPPLIKPLVIVIDEFGDLMLRGEHADEFSDGVQSIGATGRSSLVHLILATQRPERQVVPGIIKGNLPCRIALQLPTSADSMTILGHAGAERLAGRGDMLYEPPEGTAIRLQSYRA
jgi:S-DNA-T family DNA segregation ATPase FtsK/SpoIIIE